MRKILDKIFCNKRWCTLIPILLAETVYLLFVLFGSSDNKINAALKLPIISALCFLTVFLVVYTQVKNTMCPEWFLNLFELIVTFSSGLYATISIVKFFASGFQNLNFGLCMGLMTYSAVCWAHSKRIK